MTWNLNGWELEAWGNTKLPASMTPGDRIQFTLTTPPSSRGEGNRGIRQRSVREWTGQAGHTTSVSLYPNRIIFQDVSDDLVFINPDVENTQYKPFIGAVERVNESLLSYDTAMYKWKLTVRLAGEAKNCNHLHRETNGDIKTNSYGY